MKGFIFLFIAVAFGVIGWGYMDRESRAVVRKTVRRNLWAVIFALLVVALAVFFSVNTTVRLV